MLFIIMIDVELLNSQNMTPKESIKWVDSNLYNVGKASSFGAEDIVLIHMMAEISDKFQYFTLDTGFLPKATYDIIDKVESRYQIKVEKLKPDPTDVKIMVKQQGSSHGFYDSILNRKECCNIRKVVPLGKKLKELNCWITGIRRDQTVNRSDAKMFEIDKQHGNILKLNPLVNWNNSLVWEYIKQHKLEYNKLYDKNYASIGCHTCTRAVKPGESSRSGRWWWEKDSNKECGLHIEGSRPESNRLH